MIVTKENQGKGSWNLLSRHGNKQTNMFKASNESEDITKTSYKVSHLLARNMKPCSDGEIMKQAIVTCATECCSSAIQQKAKKLHLSNTTVTRRIKMYIQQPTRSAS